MNPGTIVLLGVAAALGYWAIRGRSTSATPSGDSRAPDNGGTNGGGQSSIPAGTGAYIGGDPNYSWPHKDDLTTADSVILRLVKHGYATTLLSPPTSQANVQAVGHFQNDFNQVREYLAAKGWQVPAKLTVDGKLGNKTITALWNVDAKILPQADVNAKWYDIVTAARNA